MSLEQAKKEAQGRANRTEMAVFVIKRRDGYQLSFEAGRRKVYAVALPSEHRFD